mmetsp:Transcript_28292/g.53522  ORF Transcript_28292/g.53522 Transcript_28292/m.53522 type:complete len:94 (-) Transcript_28292:58-339(-)
MCSVQICLNMHIAELKLWRSDQARMENKPAKSPGSDSHDQDVSERTPLAHLKGAEIFQRPFGLHWVRSARNITHRTCMSYSAAIASRLTKRRP